MKLTDMKIPALFCTAALCFCACSSDSGSGTTSSSDSNSSTTSETTALDIRDYYPTTDSFYGGYYVGWDEIGDYTKLSVQSYTNNEGITHWYRVVTIPNGDVAWLTAAYLAQLDGGYLVCPETSDENEFVFSLINDASYWYQWGSSHYYVMNGPPVGAFQEYSTDTESDPSSGWMWLSGATMDYTNWAVDEYCDPDIAGECPSGSSTTPTSTDQDPRDNTQPNDANGNYDQDAMFFGEMNTEVSTWGDFPVSYGDTDKGEGGTFYAFVIEYETEPE